ncbi:unnamed protein product [Vitrella brassicaformis CCMP3155]|uniref:Macro domain-containing protein n=1 Tax=Vitrella brassicaformis (strain CCMP3155) TaxID=1169540 RepID=A0A0G4GS19_VITBC|nr:unnamed protein product [Vitrella brassicaformis CCMP3155]|eukprot:CEM33159.1 unnamed protein product [Vitrella brassicaformis CCMP3155]
MSDPLSAWLKGEDQRGGARLVTADVSLDSLDSWDQTEASAVESDCPLSDVTAVYRRDDELNGRVYLWRGDICALRCDAIVNFTNESCSEASGLAGRILAIGSDDLLEELRSLDVLKTGACQITKSFNMLPRYLIHTNGPKYSAKYANAAENTLHHCHREALKLLVESGLKTIAFPAIYSTTRNYPKDKCAHVALRSVRCWLPLLPQIEAVVMVAASQEEHDLYCRIMPLCFPRNRAEEIAAANDPEFVADAKSCSATGELVCEERAIPSAIRLNRGFRHRHKQEGGSDDSSPSESENDDPLITDVDVSFCERSDTTTSEQRAAQRMPNLKQLDARRFVYYAGQDRLKRNTIVVCGALFDGQLDTSTCVSYIVSRLDPYIRDRYVLLWVQSAVSSSHHPSIFILKQLLTLFNNKYESNLDAFLVLHAGVLFRSIFALCRPVMSQHLWSATTYVESVQDLSKHFDVEQLKLPDYVSANERAIENQPTLTSSLNAIASSLLSVDQYVDAAVARLGDLTDSLIRAATDGVAQLGISDSMGSTRASNSPEPSSRGGGRGGGDDWTTMRAGRQGQRGGVGD